MDNKKWMIVGSGLVVVITAGIWITTQYLKSPQPDNRRPLASIEQGIPLSQNKNDDPRIHTPQPMEEIQKNRVSMKGNLSQAVPVLQDTSFQTFAPKNIYYRNQVITLMYHEVTPGQLNPASLRLDKFEQQLKLMKAKGFQWITMNQYINFILHGTPVPPNAVLMTFDDGYESFYQYAYPLLLTYHVPATSFLVVDSVGNPNHPGIPKVNWDQVQLMHQSGVDFYSHSFNSHMYGNLDSAGTRTRAVLKSPMYIQSLNRKETKEEYQGRIRTDLDKANSILREKIGNTTDVIAFPYGSFSPTLLRVCKDLGTKVTFTVLPGINRPGGLNGYRVNAGGAKNEPIKLIEYMQKGAPQVVRPNHKHIIQPPQDTEVVVKADKNPNHSSKLKKTTS